MGKYMRKGKTSGEVAVMEVSHHSGVRTRARTLALQRVQNQDPFSYLELRSRRLEKLTFAKVKQASTAAAGKPSPSPSTDAGKVEETPENSGSEGSVSLWSCRPKRTKVAPPQPLAAAREALPEVDAGVEVSFGDNLLELETERSARENTPCSLIRDPDTMEIPGSSTRTSKTTSIKKKRLPRSTPSGFPTAVDVEEFFAVPEQRQQQIFKEKYNFDLVNEEPLSGRYEWVKVDN